MVKGIKFPMKTFLCSYDIHSRHIIAQEVVAKIISIGPSDSAAILQHHSAEIRFILERGGNPFADEGTNVNHLVETIRKFDFKQVIC